MVYIQGKVDSQKIMRMVARHRRKMELCWMNSVEGNSYAPNNYGPMDMPMSSYPQYQRGYYPPPPPHHSSMPYYYDPMYSSQHGYAPQYGYPLQPPYY
ncbi:hypothetical protein QL285_018037 [Trifolium repens]|nr:hypothetical protein QL285_018037 [Trifolium repens]